MNGQRPVLVIHGVANHDKGEFEARVAQLQQNVNQGSATQYVFTPVFWGDLGAHSKGIEDTIPSPPLPWQPAVRADGADGADGQEQYKAISPADVGRLSALLAYRPGLADPTAAVSPPVRSDADKRDTLAAAAKEHAQGAVRDDQTAEAVAEGIRESWDDVQYLRAIEDEGLLQAVGRAVADAVTADGASGPGTDDEAADTGGQFAVRDDDAADVEPGYEVRWPHPIQAVKRVTGQVLHGVDRALGAVLGEVLGSLQNFLRQRVSRGVADFFGDVLVYQRNQAGIQDRIWSALPPPWGRDEKHAVDVVAHSLGGVIAFDAATTAAQGLFIRHFITFGSQSSFFEVIDPRQGLQPYVPGQNGQPARPVVLPDRIQSWKSLWEPLDPLAFLTRIFRLASQATPTDEMVPHEPDQLWTHSSYWTSSCLPDTIRQVLS